MYYLLLLSFFTTFIFSMERNLVDTHIAVSIDNEERIAALEKRIEKCEYEKGNLENKHAVLDEKILVHTHPELMAYLPLLEEFTTEEVAAIAVEQEELKGALLKKIVALEERVRAQRDAHEQEVQNTNEQLQSLKSQTSWLKWSLSGIVIIGSALVGYLWYQHVNTTDQLKKDQKNLINALSGKKQTLSPDHSQRAYVDTLNTLAEKTNSRDQKIFELENRPSLRVGTNQHMSIAYTHADGKPVTKDSRIVKFKRT